MTLALATIAFLFLTPHAASAQGRALLTPTGAKGTLALDTLAGFRASLLGAGIGYAGPIGISTQRYSSTDYGTGVEDTVFHYTTVWLAPSAYFFPSDPLSIGGKIDIASSSGSVDVPINGSATANYNLPTTTSVTLLPRVGYLIPLGDRWGIWPRGGIGYASRQQLLGGDRVQNFGKETFSAAILNVDVGFLFRINETFYLAGAPDLTVSLGGSHTEIAQNRSANAGFFQFGVTTGLGVFLDL